MRELIKICLWMALTCVACTPARYVKPLDEGTFAVGVDLGGPLIEYSDMTIPLPLTNLNLGYGISENTTAFGGIHTTALAFGILQLDLGALHAFMKPQGLRPGFSGSATANFMTGLQKGGARLFPQLDANAYWEYGPLSNNFFYLGVSNWFEFASTRAHLEDQPAHWLPSFQLGHTFVRSKWDYTFEFKQLAFNQDKRNIVVDYKGPGTKGASGLYLSVRRKF